MIAIPGVPGNKETSKEIRNRKICTDYHNKEWGCVVINVYGAASDF